MELFDLLRDAAPVMLKGAAYTLMFAVASMVGGLA
ncbi:MAG TPA: ABC transporter permease, partial [Telluria sp.]